MRATRDVAGVADGLKQFSTLDVVRLDEPGLLGVAQAGARGARVRPACREAQQAALEKLRLLRRDVAVSVGKAVGEPALVEPHWRGVDLRFFSPLWRKESCRSSG